MYLSSILTFIASSSPLIADSSQFSPWAVGVGSGGGVGALWLARAMYNARRDLKQDVLAEADRFEPRSNPPAGEKYATKTEVKSLRTELTARMDKMLEDGANSRKDMYKSLREVEKTMSRLEKSDETQAATLHDMSNDIKSLIAGVGKLQGKVETQ